MAVKLHYFRGHGSTTAVAVKNQYSSKSLELPNSFRNGRKKFYCHGTTTAMEVVKFYCYHRGSTAALPADDLAECECLKSRVQLCFFITQGSSDKWQLTFRPNLKLKNHNIEHSTKFEVFQWKTKTIGSKLLNQRRILEKKMLSCLICNETLGKKHQWIFHAIPVWQSKMTLGRKYMKSVPSWCRSYYLLKILKL